MTAEATGPRANPSTDLTRLVRDAVGDPQSADQLLALVYDQLRRMAQQRMNEERAGHTLQATALVHEAYLRLLGSADVSWQGRAHFFAAAAEAMRRILIERARHNARLKHGGGRQRVDLDAVEGQAQVELSDDLLAVDDALTKLEAEEPEAAAVVKMRFFAGMTIEEAAEALGMSVRTANRHWAYAKAWLYRRLNEASV